MGAVPATDVDVSVSLARITAGDSAAKSYKEVVKLWRGKSRCESTHLLQLCCGFNTRRDFFPDDLMQQRNPTSLFLLVF